MTNVSAAKRYGLHEAVVDKDLVQIRRLLEKGADINQLGPRRHGYGSALHIAIREDHPKIAKFLIDWGAEIDVLDRKDFTPLHNAAWNGNLEMTKLLLDAGADINASTYEGDTPLSLAQNNDQARVAEFIQAKILASPVVDTKAEATPVSDTGIIDISGTYISEITSDRRYAYFRSKSNRSLVITIKQDGNNISATDKSNFINIVGTKVGDTIEFYFIASHRMGSGGGNEIDGVWKANADASRFEGKWKTSGHGGASGKWNLTRIE